MDNRPAIAGITIYKLHYDYCYVTYVALCIFVERTVQMMSKSITIEMYFFAEGQLFF